MGGGAGVEGDFLIEDRRGIHHLGPKANQGSSPRLLPKAPPQVSPPRRLPKASRSEGSPSTDRGGVCRCGVFFTKDVHRRGNFGSRLLARARRKLLVGSSFLRLLIEGFEIEGRSQY